MEELQERMSSAEFTDWIKYAEHEPFGYPMDNYRFGVQTASITGAVISTIPRAKGQRRPKLPAPSDFYPASSKRQPELTKEQREHIRKKHGKRRNSNR